ncbi:helix-turn-helix domain-containing protein [Ensifer sp. SSB1]|uniref:helix-turn-helix domain-containing protein n=1 Tax=Ensifer sp. SSB1 TaxID=2795385 RepID=UPI0025C6812B|nr:helix-turn-helix domain-containing protein [Ensifer sp. SSB1]
MQPEATEFMTGEHSAAGMANGIAARALGVPVAPGEAAAGRLRRGGPARTELGTDAPVEPMSAEDRAKRQLVAPRGQRSDGSVGMAAADAEAAPVATLEDLAGMVAVQVRTQTRRIAELELALADAEARLLSQARVICGAADAAGGDLFSRRPVREIIEDVLAAYPGVTWDEIIGVGRERRLVEPRHRCMAAVYEERKDLSLPALGRIFHRDHTSVLHAVNRCGASR